MWIQLKNSLQQVIVILVAVVLVSCSSKGGGDKTTTPSPSPTPTTKSYKLGGNITGLSGGNIAISNGTDSLTLNADGAFVFLKPVTEGSLYDIKIVALPQNQLCELRNSKNYMYRDHGDVAIECATLKSKTVKIQKPAIYDWSQLILRSNYESKGGSGEDLLTSDTATLTMFDNSLISLRSKDGKLLYLSFTSSLSSDDIAIDSTSTAMALVALHPAIISAIEDLGLSFDDAMKLLTAQMSGTNEITNLATEIQKLVETSGGTDVGDLTNPKSNPSLGVALSKALDKATSIMSTIGTASLSQKPSTIGSQKLSISKPNNYVGVTFAYQKFTDTATDGTTKTGLRFAAENLTGRTVNLTNDLLQSRVDSKSKFINLVVGGTGEFDLLNGVASQSDFVVSIVGPGSIGQITEANWTRLRDATISSANHQLFYPSFNYVLGLKSPTSFNTEDCMLDKTLTDLISNAQNITNFHDRLMQSNYSSVIDDVVQANVNQFINYKNAQQLSPIEEIFSCEKFGIGKLISSKKSIAIDNTNLWIKAASKLYASNNIDSTLKLFTKANMNNLSYAITNNKPEYQWVLSNKLQLDLTTKSKRITSGTLTEFSGKCTNPTDLSSTDCTIDWDFGDGNKQSGATVSNSFIAEGNYTIKATAKDSDGAQTTQTLQLTVFPIKPIIKISLPNGGDIQPKTSAFNFGSLNLGLSDQVVLTVTNDGFADLLVTNIQSSSGVFQADPSLLSSIAPGESASVTLKFKPLAEQKYSSDISFISNANNAATFTFTMTGRGIGSAGYWQITQNGTTQTITAAKVTQIVDTTNHNLQVRIFGSANSDYPQVRLLLKNFDLNTNTRGDGTYSLDDLNAGETCLGFYASDVADLSNQFCSSTLNRTAPNIFTGSSLIVGSDSDATNKSASFDFNALSRACVGDASQCASVSIKGEAFFSSGL